MWLKSKVKECDFLGISYLQEVDGCYAIAQGASGRWCPVMVAGPDFIEKCREQGEVDLLTYEEVEKIIEERGGWLEF